MNPVGLPILHVQLSLFLGKVTAIKKVVQRHFAFLSSFGSGIRDSLKAILQRKIKMVCVLLGAVLLYLLSSIGISDYGPYYLYGVRLLDNKYFYGR